MTKYYYLEGMCKWAKVYKPDPKYNKYEICFFPEDWSKYDEMELSLEPKEDENGRYVRFRRDVEKLIKGDKVEFGPPKVVNLTGDPVTDLIGNGSRVRVKVAVFDTVKGKGHRLEGVQILELVEYHPENTDENQEFFPF